MEHQASQRRLEVEEAYALATFEARRSGSRDPDRVARKFRVLPRAARRLDGAETALTPAIVSGDGVFGDAHKRPRLDFARASRAAGVEGAAAPDAAGASAAARDRRRPRRPTWVRAP